MTGHGQRKIESRPGALHLGRAKRMMSNERSTRKPGRSREPLPAGAATRARTASICPKLALPPSRYWVLTIGVDKSPLLRRQQFSHGLDLQEDGALLFPDAAIHQFAHPAPPEALLLKGPVGGVGED